MGKLSDTFYLLKDQGLIELINRSKKERKGKDYVTWQDNSKKTEAVLLEERSTARLFPKRPLISIIVPLCNVPRELFSSLVDSVLAQTYENWELILADNSSFTRKDKDFYSINQYVLMRYSNERRIKYVNLIGKDIDLAECANLGFKVAGGEWIVILDQLAILEPDALFECIRVLNEPGQHRYITPETVCAMYTNEDRCDGTATTFFLPITKKDIDIKALRKSNYVGNLFMVRHDINEAVGGLNVEARGAEGYDYILRVMEEIVNRYEGGNFDNLRNYVHHSARVVYHAREMRGPVGSTDILADHGRVAFIGGMNVLKQHYKRLGMDVDVADSGDGETYKVTEKETKKDTKKAVEDFKPRPNPNYGKKK